MSQAAAINVQNLRIAFGGHTAVEDLSFFLLPGRTLAIVGESGSGKSLTALALIGLLPKSATASGIIKLLHHGTNSFLDAAKPDGWRGLRGTAVSMVFQEPVSALNSVMSIGAQLAEAIAAHGGASPKAAAIEWLRKVELSDPEQLYHRYPHQISGGQKQRVMIAIAMSARPSLLIADEPTTTLDVTVQWGIITLMKALQTETGTAMIFITHDLALAALLADDVMVLRGGKMVEYGPAKAMLEAPQEAYTRALLACRPGGHPKGKRLPVVADFLERNTPPEPVLLPTTKPSAEVLLGVRHLRVWFPTETNWLGAPQRFLHAVEDISFDLCKGEVLGLVGESGCGKSTVSRAIMGLQEVESGQMFYQGKDFTRLDAGGWRAMRREVQMIFQDPFSSLNPRMTVGDALREPMLVHHTVPRREVMTEARRLMDRVGLPADALSRYPHQFCGGQRQRIGIARALALRPKLIICDECVSALDMSVQAQILNLLKDLQTELGLSYLFISHDLAVVHYIADRVLVMQAGKIVERGSAEQVLTRPVEDYTKRLVEAGKPGDLG